ncbi:MAG: aminotransferase class V-fold PLP-dependent enzyme [Rubricoccaceae bacterium]
MSEPPTPAAPPPVPPRTPASSAGRPDAERLAAYRAAFDVSPGLVYLDHAAIGPLARPVRAAVAAHNETRGTTAPNDFERLLPALEGVRARLGRLLGVPAAWTEFAPNTSGALGVLAYGYPWRAGDRVAVPACEFPANVQPWRHLAARGVAVDFVPHREGTFSPDDVRAALTPRTRVLAVSWVQFLSGFRADLPALATLCRERGVWLCVDAIQGLGALAFDMDVLGADFVACGGHKWLGAPEGAAFFAVRPALMDRLDPRRGWLNGPVDWDAFDDFSDALHPTAERFRTGMLAAGPLLGLGAALDLHAAAGAGVVEAAVLEAAQRLAEGLGRLGMRRYGPSGAPASGIVTVEAPDPEGLVAHLAAEGVQVSLRSRRVRLAPHARTAPAELEAALAAVAAYVSHGRSA